MCEQGACTTCKCPCNMPLLQCNFPCRVFPHLQSSSVKLWGFVYILHNCASHIAVYRRYSQNCSAQLVSYHEQAHIYTPYRIYHHAAFGGIIASKPCLHCLRQAVMQGYGIILEHNTLPRPGRGEARLNRCRVASTTCLRARGMGHCDQLESLHIRKHQASE